MTRICYGTKYDRQEGLTRAEMRERERELSRVYVFDNWNFGWLVSRSRSSFSSLVLFLRISRKFSRQPQNEVQISWSEGDVTYIAVCLGETKNGGGKLKFDFVTLNTFCHFFVRLWENPHVSSRKKKRKLGLQTLHWIMHNEQYWRWLRWPRWP